MSSSDLRVDTAPEQKVPENGTRTSPRNTSNPYANKNIKNEEPVQGKKARTPRMKRLVRRFKSAFKISSKQPVSQAPLVEEQQIIDEEKPAEPVAVVEKPESPKRKAEEQSVETGISAAADERTATHSPKKRQRSLTKPEEPAVEAVAEQVPIAKDVDMAPVPAGVPKQQLEQAAPVVETTPTVEPMAEEENKEPIVNEPLATQKLESAVVDADGQEKPASPSPAKSPSKRKRLASARRKRQPSTATASVLVENGKVPADSVVVEEEEDEDKLNAAESSIVMQAFGVAVEKCFWNEAWSERKTGLEGVLKRVEDFKMDEEDEEDEDCENAKSPAEGGSLNSEQCLILRGCCIVLQRSLEERVAPIYLFAMDIFRASLKQFGIGPGVDEANPANGLPSSSVAALGLSGLVPQLLMRMGDSNKRSQRESCRCLLLLARQQNWYGCHLLIPYLSEEELPLYPRLTLLRLLIPETGIRKGGALTLSPVLKVAVPALKIADDKVRKAAVGVVVAAYRVSGRRVNKHLQGLKPAVMKILQRKFAEVDDAKERERNGENADVTAATPSSRPSRRSDRSSSKSRSRRNVDSGVAAASPKVVGGQDRRELRRSQRALEKQAEVLADQPPRPHSVAVGDGASAAQEAGGGHVVPSPHGDTTQRSDTLDDDMSSVVSDASSALNFNAGSSRGLLAPLSRSSISSAPTSLFDDKMYSSTTYDTYAQQQRGDWDSDDEIDSIPSAARRGAPTASSGRPEFGSKESIFNMGGPSSISSTPGAPRQNRRLKADPSGGSQRRVELN